MPVQQGSYFPILVRYDDSVEPVVVLTADGIRNGVSFVVLRTNAKAA